MQEELIDVLDENGDFTGEIVTRKVIHEKGLRHRCVIVAIIDKEGRILMQQRSLKKITNAGKWDISTAGHVSSGGTSIQTAIREVKEELGICLTEQELKFLFHYKRNHRIKEDYISNHIFDVYLVIKEEIDMKKIKKQEEEVDDVKLCGKEEVEKLIKQGKTVDRSEVYNALWKYLK